MRKLPPKFVLKPAAACAIINMFSLEEDMFLNRGRTQLPKRWELNAFCCVRKKSVEGVAAIHARVVGVR